MKISRFLKVLFDLLDKGIGEKLQIIRIISMVKQDKKDYPVLEILIEGQWFSYDCFTDMIPSDTPERIAENMISELKSKNII